jgi:hypothetical protein
MFVAIPRKDNVTSLFLAMPDDVTRDDDVAFRRDPLERLERRLNMKILNKIFDEMRPRQMDIRIPTFSRKSGSIKFNNFLSSSLPLRKNKLECLFLASLFN